jgi:hypothetical protein
MVLDPTTAGMTITKVLIDGGAGLNIIFFDTLRKRRLEFVWMINPTSVLFYEIVPSKATMPLRQITLPVTFRIPTTYRTEFIKFEVANFVSSYHAILGRQHWPNSWQYRTIHTSCSRCQGPNSWLLIATCRQSKSQPRLKQPTKERKSLRSQQKWTRRN